MAGEKEGSWKRDSEGREERFFQFFFTVYCETENVDNSVEFNVDQMLQLLTLKLHVEEQREIKSTNSCCQFGYNNFLML